MDEAFKKIFKNLDKIRKNLPSNNGGKLRDTVENLGQQINIIQLEMARQEKIAKIERAIFDSPRAIDEIMDHICGLIKEEFEFSRLDIVIIDQELKRVIQRYHRGGFGEEDLLKLSKYGALGVTKNYALSHREPLIYNDIMKDPLWKVSQELDVWVHGTFPLYYKKKSGEPELQGLIHGGRDKKAFLEGKIFTGDQIEDLKRLGFAISNEIYQAKLSYFEHGIMRIQDVIGSTHIDVPDEEIELRDNRGDSRMDRVLDAIIDVMNASLGGFLLLEESRIKALSFRNDQQEDYPPDKIDISPRPLTGLVSRALFDGHTVIENEVVQKPERLDLEIGGKKDGIHTLISVPFIETYSEEGKVRKNVIGAIILLNKKNGGNRLIRTDREGNEGGFSSLDRRILESISPHIETIVSNTKSHKKLHLLSLTDGLTGLANHTHFMDTLLPMEFKRSRRYGTPLSVILADIDHFKVFNDIFGHQVGDLVLKEVARTLIENTREVDHLARYGGEEFAVILPNTTLEDAAAYAEKMRRLVREAGYIEKIRSEELMDVPEARKRFRAMLEIDDQDIRSAKIAIMNRHFNLDIFGAIKLIDEKKIDEAENMILNSFKVTLSAGLAFYPAQKISEDRDLVTTADMLLLKAKETGRDRVEVVEIVGEEGWLRLFRLARKGRSPRNDRMRKPCRISTCSLESGLLRDNKTALIYCSAFKIS